MISICNMHRVSSLARLVQRFRLWLLNREADKLLKKARAQRKTKH